MKKAALGFRVHSGWAAMVALALEQDEPHILVRQRPKLVQTYTYEFRQPYHTAEKMPFDKAHEFISRIESDAQRLAEATIRSLQTELAKSGHTVTCFGLPLASARPLPSLDKILASHALIHTADGELFRRVLINACARCQIAAFTVKERELFPAACKALSIGEGKLKERLAAVGKPLGSPWAQDEKLAALTAWLALVSPKSTPRR